MDLRMLLARPTQSHHHQRATSSKTSHKPNPQTRTDRESQAFLLSENQTTTTKVDPSPGAKLQGPSNSDDFLDLGNAPEPGTLTGS